MLLGCTGYCSVWRSLFNLPPKRLRLGVFLLLLLLAILLLDALLHGGPDIVYLLLLLGHRGADLGDKIFVLLVLLRSDLLKHLSLLLRVHNRRVRLLQVAQLLHSVHMGDGSWQVRLLILLAVAFAFGSEVLLAQRLCLVNG